MLVKEFTEEIRNKLSGIEKEPDRHELIGFIERTALKEIAFENMSVKDIHKISKRVFYAVGSDVSVLEPYIDDENVSEIMVNGPGDVFIEKEGKLIKTEDRFFDTQELEEVLRRIAGKVHREINELVPIVDARLPDGSRVNGVYKNIAIGGPILTIRKFPKINMSMENLIEIGTITAEAAEFLKNMMKSGANIFISGGTSTGKTTFLSAMTGYIGKEERVIVIEDSAELKLSGIDNLVRMECRISSGGRVDIGMNELIKASLRMRPDRLIIGEIRDGKALLDMLNGLNTGHSGICTGHGNSAAGMIRRMEALYMQEADFPIEAIDEQIAEGIDIIIHLVRSEENKRYVKEISELYINSKGRIALNKLFVDDNSRLFRTGNQIKRKEKLHEK